MADYAVIFDWGGVLMRTEDYSFRSQWDARLALPSGGVERILLHSGIWEKAQLGHVSLEDYWDTISKILKITPDQLADLRADFYNGDRLDQTLLLLIEELREKGIAIGLLSNNTSDLADTLLDLGIENRFDATIISANIGVMKPADDAYHAILRKLQILPQNALFIDDFPQNVEGARAVGMNAMHYTPDLDLASYIDQWLNSKQA
nr:HAD family phosphatase [Anaerolineae bacterium]